MHLRRTGYRLPPGFAALLTAVLWSISSIASARTAIHLGGLRANRSRLPIALVMLGAWLLCVGTVPMGSARWWFMASGAIGLGLGDMALFCAYERLGARLPALLTHCLGAPLAALFEWAWLGSTPNAGQAWCGLVILVGVAIALAPGPDVAGKSSPQVHTPGQRWLGVIFGVLSALGLATSAVLSRQGFQICSDAGQGRPWLEAAMLRTVGGVAVTLGFWLLVRLHRKVAVRPDPPHPQWGRAWPWLLLSATVGPGLGVATFSLALSCAPAGAVQAVVALVPVLVIPAAWLINGERPQARTVIGGVIGVGGAIGMALV